MRGISEQHLKATMNAEGGAAARQQRWSTPSEWLPLVYNVLQNQHTPRAHSCSGNKIIKYTWTNRPALFMLLL